MKKLIFDPGGGLDELQIKVCSFSGPPFLFILIKAHNSVHEITKAKGSSIEVMCFNEGMVPTSLTRGDILEYSLMEKAIQRYRFDSYYSVLLTVVS